MVACKNFKKTLPENSPIQSYSQTQLLLLHTWNNFPLCISLYGRTLRIPYCHEMFDGKDPESLPISYDVKDLKLVDCCLSIVTAFRPKPPVNPFTIEIDRKNRIKSVKKLASMEEMRKSGVLTKRGKIQLKRLKKSSLLQSEKTMNGTGNISLTPEKVAPDLSVSQPKSQRIVNEDDTEMEMMIPVDMSDEQIMTSEFF